MQSTLFYSTIQTGDEDCLYVNVYVPHIKNVKSLDVVVHIHGGGFLEGFGSQHTNPAYILDRDLIFVTMHYRLGALGKKYDYFSKTENGYNKVEENFLVSCMIFTLKFQGIIHFRNNIKTYFGNRYGMCREF